MAEKIYLPADKVFQACAHEPYQTNKDLLDSKNLPGFTYFRTFTDYKPHDEEDHIFMITRISDGKDFGAHHQVSSYYGTPSFTPVNGAVEFVEMVKKVRTVTYYGPAD